MLLNETVNYVFNSNALHTEYTSMLSFHQCSGQEKISRKTFTRFVPIKNTLFNVHIVEYFKGVECFCKIVNINKSKLCTNAFYYSVILVKRSTLEY